MASIEERMMVFMVVAPVIIWSDFFVVRIRFV